MLLCSWSSSLQTAGLSRIVSAAAEFSVGEEVEAVFDWVMEEALWNWAREEAQNHSAQRQAESAFPWSLLSVSNFWREAEEPREGRREEERFSADVLAGLQWKEKLQGRREAPEERPEEFVTRRSIGALWKKRILD